MRRMLLGLCLLLLAGCGGASTSASSSGSLATRAPTSAPSPTPAVSPSPSCSTAVRHHQLGELVSAPNWQITLASVQRDTSDTTLLDIAFTFKNTTSSEVSVVAPGSSGYIFSFGLLDSTLSNFVPEVSVNANPTSIPAGGTTMFTLSYKVTDPIVKGYELQVLSNPQGLCVYGGWDINE